MSAEELDQIETDELLDPLARRFFAIFVVLERKNENGTSGYKLFYRGGWATCLGLGTYGVDDMLHGDAGGVNAGPADSEWSG